MSKKSTISLIDALGRDFDSKVLQWRNDLIPSLDQDQHVHVCCLVGNTMMIILIYF